MANSFLIGVNLAGAEFGPPYDNNGQRTSNPDPGVFGTNYTYPTHAEIDYYAAKGMSVVRLPFLWERIQPTQSGALDAAELGRLDDVVSYATGKGLKIEIELHDYGYGFGSLIGSAQTPNSSFADVWGKLAGHFSSNPDVIFGLMNEPHVQRAADWLVSANAGIAAIRSAGAMQEILVPGTDWDGGWSWTLPDSNNAAVMGPGVVDPGHNFAFEVHQYLDSDSSGTHPGVVSPTIGVERLTAITQWAEANHQRLFLGEIGVDTQATSLEALDNTLTYIKQHTDVWSGVTYWAGGPWWGDYMFSIEPQNGVDKPQMTVLVEHLSSTGLYGPNGPSIAGTSTADGNHATGENFMGPGGGSGDLFIVANHSGIRTAQGLQIENSNVLTSKVIVIVGSNVDFDGAGDLNHDGLADLLAHSDNFSTGMRSLFAYKMTPVGPAGTAPVANLGVDWVTDAFGDFNGDGTSDILLHRDSGTTRTFEVLSMNNYTVQSAPIVQVTGIDWVADGTGDFNHDGTSDILEQRIVGGSMNVQVVALQNNVVQSVSLLATIGSDWQIDGTGDFNQDGTSDFLMHRDSGGVRTLEIVTINNNTIASAQVVAQVGTNFKVDGIGDFNHDGTSDIAMHADTGTTRNDWIFTVANNVLQNAHIVASTGIDWHVS